MPMALKILKTKFMALIQWNKFILFFFTQMTKKATSGCSFNNVIISNNQ